MKRWISYLFFLTATCSLSMGAGASVIYSVHDTSVENCYGAPHGLWTNRDVYGGRCANYFSIDGTFTLYNDSHDKRDWYGHLEAKAVNPYHKEAKIDLTFKGFRDHWWYKQEGGAVYDHENVDFFTRVKGYIDIEGWRFDIDNFVWRYAFQFGKGANAKDPYEHGASAWIQSCGDRYYNGKCMRSHHWDLNLKFAKVPEPAGLLLLAFGLLNFALIRRRYQSRGQVRI